MAKYYSDMLSLKPALSKVTLCMSNYNPANYRALVINSRAWEDFCRQNKDVNSFGHFLLPNEIESELQKLYLQNVNLYFKVSFYNGEFQRYSRIFFMSSYKEFISLIKNFWIDTFKNPELWERNNYVILSLIKPFAVTGSFFHYFDKNYVTDYEIRANYGILHNVNSKFDTYSFDKKTKELKEKLVVEQDTMYFLSKGKLSNIEVSFEWQKKSKLDKDKMKLVLGLGERIEKIIKRPIELYWGATEKNIYILNINPQYDGVIDYLPNIFSYNPTDNLNNYNVKPEKIIPEPAKVFVKNQSQKLISRLRMGL